jgi:hypothetical protein
MAYGRRRRYRRRYGTRRRSVRRPQNKVAPPGSAMGVLSRVPRLYRFRGAVQRHKLVALHTSFELSCPVYPDWSITTAGTRATAGQVAAYPLQPFDMLEPVTGAYPGAGVGPGNVPATSFSTGLDIMGQHYNWQNEMREQYNEYQPMAVKYRVQVRPSINGNAHTIRQTRFGVLVSYKDSDGNCVLPTYSADANHTELDAWCNFPGVKWCRVPVMSNQMIGKFPKFAGYIQVRDYAGTGGSLNLAKNWWPIGTQIGTNFAGPTLWFFAGNPHGSLDGTGTDECNLLVSLTLYCRVRNLITKDPRSDVSA